MISETESAAQVGLVDDVAALEKLRLRLLRTSASFGGRPERYEEDVPDSPPTVGSAMALVLECVISDHVEPAIRDLREAIWCREGVAAQPEPTSGEAQVG